MKNLRIFAVNGVQETLAREIDLLQSAGHNVSHARSGPEALERTISEKPDCVLIDLMLPDMDGLGLCKRIKTHPACQDVKVVFVSSKPYALDRKRAFEMGADGYIMRPLTPESFIGELKRALEDKIEMNFWGVRGTLPVPGPDSLKYGGNTSCVSLEFAKGQFFVFDAGTGIKQLSDQLSQNNRSGLDAKIFISHPHWDHINALPFFQPLYTQGNEFEILGASHGDVTVRELISGQMDGIYFPINLNQFAARVYFRNLTEQTLEFGDIQVRTMLLNHPGACLGYRVDYKDRSICYVTDNELYPEGSTHYNKLYRDKLVEFIRETDALIIDTTYTDKEYETHMHWGHSCVSEVVDIAHKAQVKNLYLFHHDPSQNDNAIDQKAESAQRLLKELGSSTRCMAPAERTTVLL